MSHIKMKDSKAAENAMQKTWNELRNALASGNLQADDTMSALNFTFLNVFNDIFIVNNAQKYCKRYFEEFEENGQKIVRCAKVDKNWAPRYDRFLPQKEYITEDNRFSPVGVEWLYLAWSDSIYNAKECAKAECRIKSGDNMSFCEFTAVNKKALIFDLTIADHHTYDSINQIVDEFVSDTAKIAVSFIKKTGKAPSEADFNNSTYEMSMLWFAFTYVRMLSWQLFVPVNENKKYMYAPFHCFAYYLKSIGYDGIAYSSTVSSKGKNIVLFDKAYAKPIGAITNEECK